MEILSPIEEQKDENGCLKMAQIHGSEGDIVHTLIQNIDYNGVFLPGFRVIDNFKIARAL